MKKLAIYLLISFIYSINFSEDISPIIYNNCTSCHRPNEIGAFLTLEDYPEILAIVIFLKLSITF